MCTACTSVVVFYPLNRFNSQSYPYPPLAVAGRKKNRSRESEMTKDTVVLFPGMGMGHLLPVVELAKLFIRDDDIAVNIVLLQNPHAPKILSSPSEDPFMSSISESYPSISFHLIPKLTPEKPVAGFAVLVFEVVRLANPLLADHIASLSLTSRVRALVLDMFCTESLDVARQLSLPAYFFYSSSAASLAAFLLLPSLQRLLPDVDDFKELGGKLLQFPGQPPVPADHLPDMQGRQTAPNKVLIFHFNRLNKADGILINTYEWLESRAVAALNSGQISIPGADDVVTVPPVYCVGPLIGAAAGGGGEERHECLEWLDAQPKASVVFLCFGSLGAFSEEQLVEMANGLERSGQRFLWVVRSPPPKGVEPSKRYLPKPPPDLDALMPEGFLERVKGRGMVVKSWAPQAAVLAHEAVGAFVSHCGWNSTLEAVALGVPTVAWPLYAEQKMNKVFLVEEVKLAVEMKGYDKEIVSAEEIEEKVRWLFESEGGKALRERAAEAKYQAAAAKKEGGSSEVAWAKFRELALLRD